jgi:subtilase family serine protease
MNPLNPVFGSPMLQPETPPTQQLGNNLQPVSENILRQATMEGRTLFASTGDTGSSCAVLVLPVVYAGNGILNQGVPLLTYPAASPYVVGVGGTVLYANGAARAGRFLERAWEFGGGGTSVFLDAPAYQRGLPNLIGRCVSDPTGALTNTLQPCRGLPDVSAISGDVLGNGYAIVVDGHPGSQGAGTSLSAPLWAGMWARMQAASTEPRGVGFANPALYRVGRNPAAYAASFYDVTVGGNGLFLAETGWDYVSGWGTPRLTSLMRAIVGRTAPARTRPA